MKKSIKNISVFSLWVAILIFFFHAAVPHQQHLNAGSGYISQSETMGERSGSTPMNCQLFRNFSFEKTERYSTGTSNEETYSIVAILAGLGLSTDIDPVGKTNFLNSCGFLTQVFFKLSIPVRGSPFNL